MQRPLAEWPLGLCREIAAIDRAPTIDRLSEKLLFERGHDDLDAYSAAVFIIGTTYFALQHYDNIPTENFTLIVMDDSRDDCARLDDFLNWSEIPEGAITWRRPIDAG